MGAITQQLMSYGSTVPTTGALWDSGAVGSNISLSNGNRTATGITTNTASLVKATLPKTTGKFYWEAAVVINGLGQSIGIGICTTATTTGSFLGNTSGAYSWVGPGDGVGEAALMNNAVQITSSNYRYTNGAVLNFALDIAASKLWLRFSGGSWIGGGNPAAGTSPTWAIPPAGTYVIAATPFQVSNAFTLNTLPAQLLYSVPSGFQAGWY